MAVASPDGPGDVEATAAPETAAAVRNLRRLTPDGALSMKILPVFQEAYPKD
jgi:hypothetical protein